MFRGLTLLALFFFFAVFVLLIAAAADPEFLVMGGDYIGAFQSCSGGRSVDCSTYSSDDCTLTPCSEWKAFRALLAIGIIMTGITIGRILCIFCLPGFYFLTSPCITIIVGSLSSACILVSWVLFYYLSASYSAYRGAAWDIEIAAWCTSVVAVFCFMSASGGTGW